MMQYSETFIATLTFFESMFNTKAANMVERKREIVDVGQV
jgi:hypothetical protein